MISCVSLAQRTRSSIIHKKYVITYMYIATYMLACLLACLLTHVLYPSMVD